eukprot:Hpha_TRINITY_DN5449_c0_g1::TRINITY_DN5449_c0_g1_i1::g.192345::m.192345
MSSFEDLCVEILAEVLLWTPQHIACRHALTCQRWSDAFASGQSRRAVEVIRLRFPALNFSFLGRRVKVTDRAGRVLPPDAFHPPEFRGVVLDTSGNSVVNFEQSGGTHGSVQSLVTENPSWFRGLLWDQAVLELRLREPQMVRTVSLDIGTHGFLCLTSYNPGVLSCELLRPGKKGTPDVVAHHPSHDALISTPCLRVARVL